MKGGVAFPLPTCSLPAMPFFNYSSTGNVRTRRGEDDISYGIPILKMTLTQSQSVSSVSSAINSCQRRGYGGWFKISLLMLIIIFLGTRCKVVG
jgi:hypothetical protein